MGASAPPAPLSPAELVELGERHGVDAILTAELNIGDANSSVRFSLHGSVNVRSAVRAELNATLHETARGAIMWTNGAHGSWKVGGGGIGHHGGSFSVANPDARYDRMINDLVRIGTIDFRITIEKHEVPNE